MSTFSSPWADTLDADISLSSELNLSNRLETITGKAEEGSLSSGYQTRRLDLAPEEALAIAIIQQAVDDWRRAMDTLRKYPDHAIAAALRRETERFFRSVWFHRLMDLDGTAFLRRLQEEYRAVPDRGAANLQRRLDNLTHSVTRKKQRLRNHAASRTRGLSDGKSGDIMPAFPAERGNSAGGAAKAAERADVRPLEPV